MSSYLQRALDSGLTFNEAIGSSPSEQDYDIQEQKLIFDSYVGQGNVNTDTYASMQRAIANNDYESMVNINDELAWQSTSTVTDDNSDNNSSSNNSDNNDYDNGSSDSNYDSDDNNDYNSDDNDYDENNNEASGTNETNYSNTTSSDVGNVSTSSNNVDLQTAKIEACKLALGKYKYLTKHVEGYFYNATAKTKCDNGFIFVFDNNDSNWVYYGPQTLNGEPGAINASYTTYKEQLTTFCNNYKHAYQSALRQKNSKMVTYPAVTFKFQIKKWENDGDASLEAKTTSNTVPEKSDQQKQLDEAVKAIVALNVQMLGNVYNCSYKDISNEISKHIGESLTLPESLIVGDNTYNIKEDSDTSGDSSNTEPSEPENDTNEEEDTSSIDDNTTVANNTNASAPHIGSDIDFSNDKNVQSDTVSTDDGGYIKATKSETEVVDAEGNVTVTQKSSKEYYDKDSNLCKTENTLKRTNYNSSGVKTDSTYIKKYTVGDSSVCDYQVSNYSNIDSNGVPLSGAQKSYCVQGSTSDMSQVFRQVSNNNTFDTSKANQYRDVQMSAQKGSNNSYNFTYTNNGKTTVQNKVKANIAQKTYSK